MGFAREVADRIVFMNEGKIVEQAATEDFFNHPTSERARMFLDQIIRTCRRSYRSCPWPSHEGDGLMRVAPGAADFETDVARNPAGHIIRRIAGSGEC
jgi:ABC-type dipeptide/oligopeptide/nickel transport system ATPase component